MTQRIHVGLFGAAAAYNGDLTDKIFPKKVTNGAIGFTLNYELTDHLMVRTGVTYTIVGGTDRYSNKADLRLRNLSFETTILEFSALGEYNLLNLNESRYTPYALQGWLYINSILMTTTTMGKNFSETIKYRRAGACWLS